jgi:hypothetical protein
MISPDASATAANTPQGQCFWIGDGVAQRIDFDRVVDIETESFPIVCKAWSARTGASQNAIGEVGRAKTFVSRCQQHDGPGSNGLGGREIVAGRSGPCGGLGPLENFRTEIFCEAYTRSAPTLLAGAGANYPLLRNIEVVAGANDDGLGPRAVVPNLQTNLNLDFVLANDASWLPYQIVVDESGTRAEFFDSQTNCTQVDGGA